VQIPKQYLTPPARKPRRPTRPAPRPGAAIPGLGPTTQ
jgi:hypothetical protein